MVNNITNLKIKSWKFNFSHEFPNLIWYLYGIIRLPFLVLYFSNLTPFFNIIPSFTSHNSESEIFLLFHIQYYHILGIYCSLPLHTLALYNSKFLAFLFKIYFICNAFIMQSKITPEVKKSNFLTIKIF